MPRDMIPDDTPLDPGRAMQPQAPNGSLIPVIVTALNEAMVTLDANHPRAGKDLTFAVEIMAIAWTDQTFGDLGRPMGRCRFSQRMLRAFNGLHLVCDRAGPRMPMPMPMPMQRPMSSSLVLP